jgi:prepilin-type N-terminal cleavage/methylation domain-containing protein
MMRSRRPSRGFTLAELMIACIVISILALIAIPRFRSARHRAFEASLKSDLKNLATQQELFYRDANLYSADRTALGVSESEGVTITINEASNVGWSAQAEHVGLPEEKCGIYSGKAAPAGGDPATGRGRVECTF